MHGRTVPRIFDRTRGTGERPEVLSDGCRLSRPEPASDSLRRETSTLGRERERNATMQTNPGEPRPVVRQQAFFALALAWSIGSSAGAPGRAAPPKDEAELFELPEHAVDRGITAYRDAVRALHERALRSRKPWREEDLRKDVPRRFLELDERYSRIKDAATRARALAELALVDADLAWVERIDPLVEKIAKDDADLAARLGRFGESDHFFVRVVGADPTYADAALRLGEAIHAGYRDRFGFETPSKVPGKKIRIVIHVDPKHPRPRLYFHPTPAFHGEIRYEIPDEKSLTLSGGQRIVYGFGHELGHMIAMWGEYRRVEDDKHAWAHYLGCLLVEDVYERLGNEPWPGWTAFQRRASGVARLEKQIEGHDPALDSYEGILALFHTIGEELGTEIYGKAWKWLEEKRRFRRLQHVPYLWMRDLRDALLAVAPPEKRARIAELFGGKR